jgi:hypothetical protein
MVEDIMPFASLRSHTIAGLVATSLLTGSGGAVVGQTDAARWREDLKLFAAEPPRLHRNLFDNMTREQFDRAVSRLDERIPSMEIADITAELTRIVGMIQDGHARIVELSGPTMLGWRRYPVRFALFSDGLFVEAASPDHAALVGLRVKQVGAMDAEKAVAAVTPFVPRDNSMNAGQRVPGYLAFPEVLRAAGVTADRSTISLVLDGPDGAINARLEAISAAAPVRWMTMRDAATGPRPRWAPRPESL